MYWLMKEISNDQELQLQLIVTGAHLSHDHGMTYKLIEDDGFHIDVKIDMLLSNDTAVGVTKSLGLAMIGFADAYQVLSPDIVVVLGDRYEILAATQAALIAGVPVAHLHGGEVTAGAIDESIRHSVTKMSHFHFVASEEYRRRVMQLGESPEHVYNFGAVGLDNINRLQLLSKEDLQQKNNFKLKEPTLLVTYHPVTNDKESGIMGLKNLLIAMDAFPEASILITKSNADVEGKSYSMLIDEYAAQRPEKVRAFITMGQINYLSAMRFASVVVGNSSSGIIEAPFFKTATVNIGKRQDGRLKARSIIDCSEEKEEIINAIKVALSSEFRDRLPSTESLYGQGATAAKIKETLKRVKLNGIQNKKFYDLGV